MPNSLQLLHHAQLLRQCGKNLSGSIFGTNRKIRLATCAMARVIWHMLTDGRSRKMVEAAEKRAGSANRVFFETMLVYHDAYTAVYETEISFRKRSGGKISRQELTLVRALQIASLTGWTESNPIADLNDQIEILIEYFPEFLEKAIGAFNCIVEPCAVFCLDGIGPGKAKAVAEQIYKRECPKCEGIGMVIVRKGAAGFTQAKCPECGGDKNSWHLMPQLWDLLEESGCEDQTVREHLCSKEPHYLGCWVIDALLGRR